MVGHPKQSQKIQIQTRTLQQLQLLAPHDPTKLKIPSNDIASRELVSKINAEHEKSDRLTVAKLNNASKPYKQDYKSKIMTEKYSLLPINPQQLTPAQTALQRMSEKHPDFEIQPTPLDPQIMNIQRHLNYWYQLIRHYWSLENTFLDNLTLTKL